MRKFLLVGAVAASALVLSPSLGTASPMTSPVPILAVFGFTSQIVDYTVPATGTYEIVASGAQGGTEPYTIGSNATGGDGAQVTGDFSLTAGEVLRIAVGGKGGDGPGFNEYGAGGGGGGTFVLGSGNGVSSILLIAGGGGGGGAGSGNDGLSPINVRAQNGSGGGGDAGFGGHGGVGGIKGGGGGGFIGDGGDGSGSSPGKGGNSFADGLGGGGSGTQGGGGFGGGGGGNSGNNGGGGGGGGYDGGGGGSDGQGGGGGGSVINTSVGTNFSRATGGGNGSVIIEELPKPSLPGSPAPVPEPASLALFGTALAGLGLIRRHRRGLT